MYYEAKYGSQTKEWTDIVEHSLHNSDESFQFNYDISQRDQQIYLKVGFDFTGESSNMQESEEILTIILKFTESMLIFQFSIAFYLKENIKSHIRSKLILGLQIFQHNSRERLLRPVFQKVKIKLEKGLFLNELVLLRQKSLCI